MPSLENYRRVFPVDLLGFLRRIGIDEQLWVSDFGSIDLNFFCLFEFFPTNCPLDCKEMTITIGRNSCI